MLTKSGKQTVQGKAKVGWNYDTEGKGKAKVNRRIGLPVVGELGA